MLCIHHGSHGDRINKGKQSVVDTQQFSQLNIQLIYSANLVGKLS